MSRATSVTLAEKEVEDVRFLFLKAFLGLLAYDLFLLNRNFGALRRVIHRWKVSGTSRSPFTTFSVCNAVNRACIWYPKQALCLQRSAVTTCLLRSCGVPAEMVLGAQKIPFTAHAWVEVGGQAVNENQPVHARYGVWDRC
jgi:hypothetical protein